MESHGVTLERADRKWFECGDSRVHRDKPFRQNVAGDPSSAPITPLCPRTTSPSRVEVPGDETTDAFVIVDVIVRHQRYAASKHVVLHLKSYRLTNIDGVGSLALLS